MGAMLQVPPRGQTQRRGQAHATRGAVSSTATGAGESRGAGAEQTGAPCLNAIYEKRNPSGVWPKWLTVALDIDAVTYGRVYMFSDSVGEGPNSLQVITPKPRCRVLLPI